jgi:hypothetical protein
LLLDGVEFSNQLFRSIKLTNEKLIVCSAFVKLKALQDTVFTKTLIDKEVVVVARWQKYDLIAGASDLEVYELCKKYGWKFGVDLNLHGKFFVIDEKEIFLGSANLTQRGLHIGLTGNNEFGTKIPAEKADLNKINNFIESEVTWMNDELFEILSNEVQVSKKQKNTIQDRSWSKSIDSYVNKAVEFLWVQELVFLSPEELLRIDLSDERSLHDLNLLGLNFEDITEVTLKRAFKRTRLYRWLTSILSQDNLRFGGVTAKLHSAILDDPKPYRVDIKNYNQIIFKWAEFLDEDFCVFQPNHTQVLSLKEAG